MEISMKSSQVVTKVKTWYAIERNGGLAYLHREEQWPRKTPSFSPKLFIRLDIFRSSWTIAIEQLTKNKYSCTPTKSIPTYSPTSLNPQKFNHQLPNTLPRTQTKNTLNTTISPKVATCSILPPKLCSWNDVVCRKRVGGPPTMAVLWL